jgi:Helix-turn-helix domain
MLRILSLTPAQQRELRRWQHSGDFHLARRAQVVLWSARGWSVPALACTMGCCRWTVRWWLHAFRVAGLAGLQARCTGRARRRAETVDSALGGDNSVTSSRVVPISVPELRRVLAFH